MLNFIKNLLSLFFSKQKPDVNTFALGAILNDPDNRDISYPAVVGVIPETFLSQITVPNFLTTQRLMQGNLGTCVEHALEFIKRNDDNILHSRRVPYVITRNALGWTEANGQGLPQREAAKTATIIGTPKDTGLDSNAFSHALYASLQITQAMRDDANIYKFGGFSFPIISESGIKQSLQNGKLVAVTIAVDWNAIDPDGTIHPAKNLAGYHEVVIGQSDDATGKFRCANWWPIGDLFIKYSELESLVFDAINFTEIPEDLKLRAKQMQYIFTADLSIGMKSSAVGQLQKRLVAYGTLTGAIDNSFGLKTLQAVKDYQRFKGIGQDGKVGPTTRQALNSDSGNGIQKSKIDLWMEAAIMMEGAKPSRNNPINLRFRGQQFAVNDNGFCKFDTYAHGYTSGRNLIMNACLGLSSNYKADETLYEFYSGIETPNRYGKKIDGFAPASDNNQPKHYAEVVAQHINCDPNVKIKELLS